MRGKSAPKASRCQLCISASRSCNSRPAAVGPAADPDEPEQAVVFGEMSLMTGEARRATVVALGEVGAVRVDKDSFRDVLAVNPAVVEEISRILALRQSDLEERAATPADTEKAVERRSVALMRRVRGFFRL